MKQKSSIICDFCKDETDSNEHMFLNCVIIRQLWREVENWISQIGVVDYIINEERIILGELKKITLVKLDYSHYQEDNFYFKAQFDNSFNFLY